VVESATTFLSAGKLALPLNEAPSQYLTKTRFQLKKSGLVKTGVFGVSFKFESSGLRESQRDKELGFTRSTKDSRVPVVHKPAFNRPSDLDSNISHKNQEISILTIKKNQSKLNTSSTSHRRFQRRKDKTESEGPRNKNKKIKTL
jgi:hypothetical protein